MLKRVAASVVAVGAVAVVWAGSASGTTGSQRFSISAGNTGGSVYASGPISGSGRLVTLSQNLDRFVFPGGSLLLRHQPSSQHPTLDPRRSLAPLPASANDQ